jgi:hypothetical protein
MSYILTDIGEEWYTETALQGATVTVTLYSDASDNISDTDDLSAINTEPAGGSFSRLTDTVSVADISGNWGFQNDSELVFNTSDSSQTVDGAAIIVNFDSDEAGDGGTATDHLIGTSQLSQPRDLSQVDELYVNPGELGVTVN